MTSGTPTAAGPRARRPWGGVVRWLVWFLWPALALTSLFALASIVILPLADDPETASLAGWIGLLWIGASAALAIVMIVKIFKALGMLRRRLGWLTRSEQRLAASALAYQQGFESAAELKARLVAGGEPVRLTVWDVMLEPDETLLMDASLQYSRWYGTDAVYTHTSTFAVGRPSFVAGALVGDAIGNAIARSNAVSEARTRWREQQNCRTLVTDRRILCRASDQWLSFYYGGVVASHPDVLGATLILEFSDTAALRLHGVDGPGLCVFVTALLQGRQSLEAHPALGPLALAQAQA